MTKSENQSKRPTHAIWQVLGDGDKARWIRVGAAWTNRDCKGFTVKFDAYPVAGRTIIREFSEQQPAQ